MPLLPAPHVVKSRPRDDKRINNDGTVGAVGNQCHPSLRPYIINVSIRLRDTRWEGFSVGLAHQTLTPASGLNFIFLLLDATLRETACRVLAVSPLAPGEQVRFPLCRVYCVSAKQTQSIVVHRQRSTPPLIVVQINTFSHPPTFLLTFRELLK